MTNFDKLTLEIETDGTITPEEALGKAADILVRQFSLFAKIGMAALPAERATRARPQLPPNMLDMPIEELDLPMRAYNSLKRNNIVKVGQLLQLSDDDLLRMRNFGKKSLDEMKERLRMRGFILPESEERAPRTRGRDRRRGLDDASRCRRAVQRGGLIRGPSHRRPQAQPQAGPAARALQEPHRLGPPLRAVKTTEAKAKEIRPQVERMITLAKKGDLTARRAVISALPNEPLVVSKLFDEIAPKYADRTSGYTRIVKVGQRRKGDAAPIVQIELV